MSWRYPAANYAKVQCPVANFPKTLMFIKGKTIERCISHIMHVYSFPYNLLFNPYFHIYIFRLLLYQKHCYVFAQIELSISSNTK